MATVQQLATALCPPCGVCCVVQATKNVSQGEEMMRLRQELKDTRAALGDCEAIFTHRVSHRCRRLVYAQGESQVQEAGFHTG